MNSYLKVIIGTLIYLIVPSSAIPRSNSLQWGTLWCGRKRRQLEIQSGCVDHEHLLSDDKSQITPSGGIFRKEGSHD